MRNNKMWLVGLLLLTFFLLSPAQAAAQSDVPPEVDKVYNCFERGERASSKLDCMFNETFITYFLIPAILVFVLVYGLTDRLDFFESNKVNALLGAALALLVMFNANQLYFIGDTISDLGPGPIIFILFVFTIIAAILKAAKDGDT